MVEELKQKIQSSQNCFKYIGNVCVYHNTNNFQHLRKKYKFNTSTPFHPLVEGSLIK